MAMLPSHRDEELVGSLCIVIVFLICFNPGPCGGEGVLFPTGGTVTDLDGDGQLELLLAHGESAQQPISVFKVTQVRRRAWMWVHRFKNHIRLAGAARSIPN